ncbi:hypothetical protein BN946_scf184836.g3 [Trametes cinnabarina]|uniref:Nephrocystin 3-like N-terminal domain-containing protein n=1 Tax=Pycnoporus cinnabarinus TaxID=5643 RepID=A0A060SCC4_PYCCI|nr:hypothetical protein BN946_scf184836.g3 [Trametes cinnabarina]
MSILRSKRLASPASSTSASPSSAADTQSITYAAHSRRKELVKIGFGHLIRVLKVTKEVSSACPQLQTAVGALLIVLEAYQKYSEAIEAIETLLSRIESMNNMLNKVQREDGFPQALKERLAALAEKVKEVVKDAEEVQSKRRMIQFLKAADYAERTESWIKTLDWHIRSFVLEGTITLELTVHVRAPAKQGFEAMNTRFDKVDDGIKAVKDGVNELHDDVNLMIAPDDLYKALRPVIEARFDYGSSVHVQCHENTRGEVLATLCSWLRPDHPRLARLPEPAVPALADRSILWLHALAGSGKSTIALTVADWWDTKSDQLLGASFFCARDGQRSNVNCIFRTLAYQLARHFPAFEEQLTKVIEKDPDLHSSVPVRQLQRLIVEPLQAVHANAKSKGTFPAHVAVVIDALDECTDDSAVSTILKCLSLHISELAPLKFLITSRPEENIARGFLLQNLRENTQELALNKVPDVFTKRDISTFLQSRLAAIRDQFALPSCWLSSQQLKNLVDLSELLFIFSSAAARYIGDHAARDPEGRLTSLLDAGNTAAAKRGITASPFPILDALYIQVLENAARKLEADLKARLKLILGTIALAEQRLTPTTLDALLDLRACTVRRILPVLSAILTIPDSDSDSTPIRVIHLSFPNFLIDPTRCTDQSFLVRPLFQHSHLALQCMKLMQSLKYNICQVASEHDHLENSEIPDLPAKAAQHLPAALQYACKYWTRHMCQAEVGEELLSALEEFSKSRLLYWLEALSLLGCVDGAIEALQSVQIFLKASPSQPSNELSDTYAILRLQSQSPRDTKVSSLLYDCERVVRAFYPIISTSTMHMYSTIALFSPLESPLRRLSAANAHTSLIVRVGVENVWSTTLASHVTNRYISAVAFSPDAMCVACGHRDGTIDMLNAQTAAKLLVFVGHTDSILCVSFSPTGKELLSGSSKGTVYVWDVATGAPLHAWKEHSSWICSVAWSHNGKLAASASCDGTVRLWRVASPEKMVVLRHGAEVCDAVFALDGDLLSGLWDEMCKVWDTRSVDWDVEAKIAPTRILEHDSAVRAVAVSYDSCLVACGLESGKIVLWKKSDGQRVRSFPGQSRLTSLAFYPNGLLAAAYEKSFTLWDVSRGARVKTTSHERAEAVAFASDGLHIAHVVGQQVQIRLWGPTGEFESDDPTATSLKHILKQRWRLRRTAPRSFIDHQTPVGNPRSFVHVVATSPAGNLILVVYEDELQIHNVTTGECTHTINHSSEVGSVAAWSSTGKLFSCTGKDDAVRVWKADTGEHVGTFTGHSAGVIAVVFTRDEQHVLSASWNGSIHRGKIGQPGKETSSEAIFKADRDEIDAFAVSSDDQWMLCGVSRRDSPPDTSSADLLATSSRQLVESHSAWYYTLRLHDASTGRVLWIEHQPSFIWSVAFSEDCTRALAGNAVGEVFLYDLTEIIPPDHTAPRSPPPLAVPEHKLSVRGTGPVRRVAFSPDGRALIINGSYTSIPSKLRPLCMGPANRALTTMFYSEDDWLWSVEVHSEPRRLCWIPSSLRPHKDILETVPKANVNVVAYRTSRGRLTVIEVRCG